MACRGAAIRCSNVSWHNVIGRVTPKAVIVASGQAAWTNDRSAVPTYRRVLWFLSRLHMLRAAIFKLPDVESAILFMSAATVRSVAS